MVKHLDHMNLSVKSFSETADWYGRVFGFRVVESGVRAGRKWGILQSGEALLCAYEDGDRAFLDGDALESKRLHGVNHFSFRITDRAKWEATLEREQVPVHYGGAYRYPHSTSWYVDDPTGYEIEVVLWDEDKVAFAVP